METFSNLYFVFETQIMVYYVIVHLYERVFSSVVDLKNHQLIAEYYTTPPSPRLKCFAVRNRHFPFKYIFKEANLVHVHLRNAS